MEWFAITSAVTTSLAWAGTDARARGAWVSVADVCRQTMTEGRIRDARTQVKRVCRLARVGVGDLRAAVDAGLFVYEGDDLVVVGWDHAKEREAARAVKRAREHRARQSTDGASEESTPLPTPASAPSPASSPVVESAAADSPTPSRNRSAFAYAHPYADPNIGTEKRREDQTTPETPPPSPQGVTAGAERVATTAAAATAQGQVPECVRAAYANDTQHEPPSAPGSVRVRQPHAGAPESHESAGNSAKSPPPLATKRTTAPTRVAVRLAALSDDALGVITALGGCRHGPGGADYTPEWQREITGMDAREVLALCLVAHEPIRLPSGLRREIATWKAQPLSERRRVVEHACQVYDLPMTRRPQVPP